MIRFAPPKPVVPLNNFKARPESRTYFINDESYHDYSNKIDEALGIAVTPEPPPEYITRITYLDTKGKQVVRQFSQNLISAPMEMQYQSIIRIDVYHIQ